MNHCPGCRCSNLDTDKLDSLAALAVWTNERQGTWTPLYQCTHELTPIIGEGVLRCEKAEHHDPPHQQGETTWWKGGPYLPEKER